MNASHLAAFRRNFFHIENIIRSSAMLIKVMPVTIKPNVASHSEGRWGLAHISVCPRNVTHIFVNPSFVVPEIKRLAG